MTETVKRIAIVGISGSGKSTLARKLGERFGLPVYHMDSLYWAENWQEVPEAEWKPKEAALLLQNQWIIEGYIGGGFQDRLSKADLVINLDFSGWKCAWNGLRRWWQFRKHGRPELPPGCHERFRLSFFWIMLMRKERADIEGAIRGSRPKQVIALHSKIDLDRFFKYMKCL